MGHDKSQLGCYETHRSREGVGECVHSEEAQPLEKEE